LFEKYEKQLFPPFAGGKSYFIEKPVEIIYLKQR